MFLYFYPASGVLSLRGRTLQGLGLYSCWNAVLEVVLALW